jgi:hypothetical protein
MFVNEISVNPEFQADNLAFGKIFRIFACHQGEQLLKGSIEDALYSSFQAPYTIQKALF